MDDVVDVVVPSILFMGMTLTLIMMFFWRYRAKRDVQETIQRALEKGAELTPELLARLGEPVAKGETYMRRGVIWLAAGIAIAVFGVVVGEEDAIRPMLAIGCFPAIIGAANLLLWKITGDKDEGLSS